MDGNEDGDRLVLLGRALGCDVRLVVLQVLAEGEASVGDLVDRTGTTQPNMSNHLAVLRSAGLVTYRRDGRAVRYRLASPEVAGLARHLTALAGPPARSVRNGSTTDSTTPPDGDLPTSKRTNPT